VLLISSLSTLLFSGHAGFAKQRGIHRGTVFIRWMNNLILVVVSEAHVMEWNGMEWNDGIAVWCQCVS